MRPTVRFAQVLEEKLADEGGRPRVAPAAQRATPVPPPASMLFASDMPFRCSRVAWVSSAYGRPVARVRPEPARPAPRLSSAQRAALECLRGFGAGLDEACSDDELKSAFRNLALRFHPDRHPQVADGDREYLASAFGRITEAYRVLAPRSAH